ncbi:MAG: transcriptional regulator [Muricauda sp.]|jgi:DNA-binding transcriptional ArsR family regulator|nr:MULTISPECIES: metalloregulator ArsR/SmtB family transcription factor [unclassified Allomuricauda]MAU14066.1 transcriptional regulator [Allomuricauda sp.]|tara:strand:- start:8473 stop:8844 length:372 start_codon:yes stop_codon:yes gene_type:complete
MKLEISCTRAEADHQQILRCKEDLNRTADSIEDVSRLMALAGNEVRFKILFLLQKEIELCPCDFADILEMSVPAVSQHLRKMKDAKIIGTRRQGQTIFYHISKKNEAFFAAILSNVQSKRKIA